MLIETDYLKTFLNISDDDHDDKLEQFIKMASDQIEKWCRQPILKAVKTLVFSAIIDGQKTHTLNFTNVPISLTSIHYRSAPDESWEAATGIVLLNESEPYQLWNKTGFKEGIRNYKAVLEVGYVLASMPPSITRVACEITKELVLESGHGIITGKSEIFKVSSISKTSSGGITETTNFIDLNPRWQNLMEPFRANVL